MNDIIGLGKVLPIEKLIDVISNYVGLISKSYFDRKNIDTTFYKKKKLAEADAERIRIIAEADAERIRIIAEAYAERIRIIAKAIIENSQQTGGIEYKDENLTISSQKEYQASILVNSVLEERIQQRINFQEIKKQLNLEKVIFFAVTELENEQPVTNEPLDKDWTTRFFRIVEDVSNEEMQKLWGKILAGEIKQPNSFSLRTLELVRNLSQKEAFVFSKIANYAIYTNGKSYIFYGNKNNFLRENYDIKYRYITQCVEVGLIQLGNLVNHKLSTHTEDKIYVFQSGRYSMTVAVKANTPTIKMPAITFSNAGNELLRLISAEPSIEYLNYIAGSIKQSDSVSVEIKDEQY